MAVCTSVSDSPSSALISSVVISSAFEWLPASITSRRSCGASHTRVADWRVKARGSSSCSACSFSSLVSFLPGLRPVVCSMWATISSTR